MSHNPTWSAKAAEYEDACARLTLIKPEIVPVLAVRSAEERARAMDMRGYRMGRDAHDEVYRLGRLEKHARGLIESYAAARAGDMGRVPRRTCWAKL